MKTQALNNLFFKPYFARMARKIDLFESHALKEQEQLFKRLMKKVEKTSFGRDHQLKALTTYEEFVSQVPVHSYARLLPYIHKIQAGEKDVLYPGRPLYLATTSGTTSGEKYIPVTKDSLSKGMKSSVLCTATYLRETKNYSPLLKKMVILSANPKLQKKGRLLYGKITGIFNRHIPRFMKKQRIPSVETNKIEDWDLKMLKTVEESIGQNVGMVGGFPGWIIRYFERILEKTGKKTIKEVFPHLEIITHGGVAYGPYQSRMEELIGGAFHRLEVFSATEGFFAFQDRQGSNELLLVPNGEVFYEFIPLDLIDSKNPPRIRLSEVETGIPYAMIISTLAGLWAYDLGDTVTFTSTSPFRLKVSGRTKHFISNSGEHLISEQVEEALQKAADSHRAKVNDFSVAPHITSQGNRHEWLIEFEKEPQDWNLFISDLNLNLCSLSDNYQLLIEGSVLVPPLISSIEKGGFVSYMKSINKMTHQNKVPRLMNNRQLADAMTNWKRATHG